ncbi:MAG: hypothetical protein V1796_08335 [Pseudomonadota bacterium]
MTFRSLLACFAAAALFPLGASAQSACRVLDPELAGIYRGGCKGGLAEGYGEAKGTAEYRGEFHAGRKHGKGVKIWPSGDRYEGEFAQDHKEGIGRYSWSARGPTAGERYSGAYVEDRRHGHGVYEWPSGDRYAGPWANDEVTGMPTPMMIARARAKTETLAAVGKPGVKVCRALLVGIAVRDWIRGEVTAVDAERIAVRIDDPGRQPHVIGDRPLAKGMTIWSAAMEWTPCL